MCIYSTVEYVLQQSDNEFSNHENPLFPMDIKWMALWTCWLNVALFNYIKIKIQGLQSLPLFDYLTLSNG